MYEQACTLIPELTYRRRNRLPPLYTYVPTTEGQHPLAFTTPGIYADRVGPYAEEPLVRLMR